MDVTPLIPQSLKLVEGYAANAVKISGKTFSSSILLMPFDVLPLNFGAAEGVPPASSLLAVIKPEVEILLMGIKGVNPLQVKALKAELKAKNIALDVMDVGAAARTYNVLAAEGRPVAAAFIL